VDGLKHGFVWQLLSFQLMHASLWHVAGNCYAIYLFGRDVEVALGAKSFLTLYFSSGVVGGFFQALTGVLLPNVFGGAVVGASAGAFGLVAAYALLYPDRVLLLFFILPIRAKYLLLLEAVLAILGITFPANNELGPKVAHAAHLGGMLAGFAFVRYAVHWHFQWPQLPRARRAPVRRLVKVPAQKPSIWARDKEVVEEELPPDEFLSKEVDPILDKISAKGIQSLTERERQILETARTKMRKR
jgi:membrane associated rhomboid family serine protease